MRAEPLWNSASEWYRAASVTLGSRLGSRSSFEVPQQQRISALGGAVRTDICRLFLQYSPGPGPLARIRLT